MVVFFHRNVQSEKKTIQSLYIGTLNEILLVVQSFFLI